MKRLIPILLILLLLFGCRDSGQHTVTPKTGMKVGVALYDQYDTFIGEITSRFISAARQKEIDENVTITILRKSADGSQALQNAQVESFIESGCDILCVNLVDRTDASVIIDNALAAGIPVLFFNRELVEEDLQRSDMLYYVGANAPESGRLQGEIVADIWRTQKEKLDKNGDDILQYIMLEGEAGHQDAIVRTESSVNAVTDAGIQVERLEDEIANWTRSQAETKMTQFLSTHGDAIELVFSNNDDMALGAIDAFNRAEIPGSERPLIVGIDGTSVGLDAVLRGEMAGTVYNDSRGQAQMLLELAYALTFNAQPPKELQDGKYIRLPYKAVTAENVAEFIE